MFHDCFNHFDGNSDAHLLQKFGNAFDYELQCTV